MSVTQSRAKLTPRRASFPLSRRAPTQADEYMDVVYKLWESSWSDDAVRHSIPSQLFTDPTRVQPIHHTGPNYSVPGPHICEPSLQRTPVIFQAGSSGPGLAFAGKHAEVVFIAAHRPDVARKRVDAARAAASAAGRDPKSLKVLALLCPIVGTTDGEAHEKHADFLAHGSDEGALALFGGWTGMDLSPYSDDEELRTAAAAAGSNAIKSAIDGFAQQDPSVQKWTKREVANLIKVGGLGPVVVGSPEGVADQLEEWVREAGVDGFNLAYAVAPGTFVDFIELVLPILRQRGHVWAEYPEAEQEPAGWKGGKELSVSQGAGGFGAQEVLGLTAREKLYGVGQRRVRDDHYASRFRWRAGQPAPELPGPSEPCETNGIDGKEGEPVEAPTKRKKTG